MFERGAFGNGEHGAEEDVLGQFVSFLIVKLVLNIASPRVQWGNVC